MRQCCGRVSTALSVRREVTIACRTALVGGGSSGIGRAAAESLARAGLDVVLFGRQEQALTQAADQIRASCTGAQAAQVRYGVGDLADPASSGARIETVEG